jgi:hypothetical protein
MALSSETVKTLDLVKKSGKPCKFVLINKGADVVSVVVYRKGSDDGRIREAKEAGSGNVSCGVVDGKGSDLTFKLLRADGYNNAPVKNTALKEFMNKGTELKLKPTIEIVDQLPAVEMELDGSPQRPTQTLPPVQQGTGGQPQGSPPYKYRTPDEWKAAVAAIQQAQDLPTKMQLLTQAAQLCRDETSRVQGELKTDPNSTTAKAQSVSLGKVADILKKLAPPMPQAPLSPPQQKLKQAQIERDNIRQEIALAASKVQEKRHLLDEQKIAAVLQECETDANSDFGQIVSLLDLNLMTKPKNKNATPRDVKSIDGKFVDSTMKQLIAAKQKATAYIKEHKDPLVGSLPSRVKKRRQYCEQYIKQIDDYIAFIGKKHEAALDLCQKYSQKAKSGEYASPEIALALHNMLSEPLLTDEAKFEIRQTIDLLSAEMQKQGFDLLAKSANLTEKERLEIMEAYGCGSKPSGGTSDVKLLKSKPDGGIEFALKSAAQESEQALEQLGLPNGACAIREDVSSTVYQKFMELSGIDLGFPKSEVAKLNGQIFAKIEGIKGKMADREGIGDINREIESAQALKDKLIERKRPPEELQRVDEQLQKLQAKLATAKQDIENIPDQVSSESMGKVLMSTILTCQWDCKWGNLIVEGNTARPIDAGAALPTPLTIDGFLSTDKKSVHRMPALEQLLQYPGGHSKAFQDLPIANQPVDPNMVAEMLKLDPDVLVQAAKDRRDQVLRDNPSLGGGQPLLEDVSLAAMKDSITGAQAILRSKPGMTLKEFVVAWSNWFKGWAAGFYQKHVPQPT